MNPTLRERSLTLWLAKLLLLSAAILVSQAARAAVDPWPRQIQAKEGKVVIYQPQLESFQGDKVAVRAAVSVQKTTMKTPVFGVVWFDSRIATDRDQRTVEFQAIKVAKIKFPNAKPEQERRLATFLEREIAGWAKPTMALDRLLASLAELEKAKAGANYNNAPPKILFTSVPSVLVLIDGQPILRDVEGSAVKRVVNTPFVLLFDPAGPQYYLTGDALWFAAPDLMGSWKPLDSPPAAVASAAQRIAEAEVPTQVRPQTLKAEAVPQIRVATEPTELIVTDGEPQFAPLEDTDLLYLSNSGRDVFQVVSTQQYYVLLAGRWFRGPDLQKGPWSYVRPDQLPAGFYRIAAGSAKGHVLAFVPDTPQAQEAVADAQIPVTAAVPRTATTKISYDGEPQFQPIEGTSLQYAVNTTTPVIKAQDKYYAVERAVWYESAQPQGTYTVTTSVPQEIYEMPPSSPVYNVKYVQVYQSTPEVVYVGYTPGYAGTYVAGGTVVYGTGYVYPPYVAPTVYYPAPVTYGYAPVYDPGYAAWNFMAGATFGFIAGAAVSNWWGGCGCCGWHGDVDVDINRNVNLSRDYVRNLNVNRANFRNTNLNRQDFQSLRANRQDVRNNVYNNRNWSQSLQNSRRSQLNQRVNARERGEQPRLNQLQAQRGQQLQARPGQRPAGQAGRVQQRQGTPGARPAQRTKPAELGRNNVFASGDGNVYRRSQQGWEQRDRSGWSRPETRAQPSFESNRSNLDRDYGARTRGAERTQSFQQARGGGGFQRGGGMRGGGGRRR